MGSRDLQRVVSSSLGGTLDAQMARSHPVQTEAELGSYVGGGRPRQIDDKAEAMFEWTDNGTTAIAVP